MTEPIDTIIAAFMARDYRISDHVWENFVLEDDRPDPDEVVAAFLQDDPVVVSHDRNNPRGSSCDVRVTDSDGRLFLVTIGYGMRPITVVTAYYEG